MSDSVEEVLKYAHTKQICMDLVQKKGNLVEDLKDLQELLRNLPKYIIDHLERLIISSMYTLIASNEKRKENVKILISDVLGVLFNKITIKQTTLFFNLYAYFLLEIFDLKKNRLVAGTSEEYKLSVIQSLSGLFNCLSWDILPEVYKKENTPKLSQIMFACLEISKAERFKALRIAAMECLMVIARVSDKSETNDVVIQVKIADVFAIFLPGLSTNLIIVATTDEKAGHEVISTALKAWGRIITVVMRDYGASDAKIDLRKLDRDKEPNASFVPQLKTKEGVDEFIKVLERTPEWFKQTDIKLESITRMFYTLTNSTHQKIKLQLAQVCFDMLIKCFNTTPKSLVNIIEIVMILSEDEDEGVSLVCQKMLVDLTEIVSETVLENSEENFYKVISTLPRIFNSIDEKEQLRALNLIIGYQRLFGKHKMVHILHSSIHLKHFLMTLMHVLELEKNEVSLLEEPVLTSLDSLVYKPWKVFRYFREEAIYFKLQVICQNLARPEIFDIVFDFLLDVYTNQLEHRKEATLILNEFLASGDLDENKIEAIKIMINTYLETDNWYLPVEVGRSVSGVSCTLGEVRNNLLQVCLQLEGFGKMALVLKERFQDFLLKTLYVVLECAGSSYDILRFTGATAVENIATACNCKNVTELINSYSDYFSFQVTKRLSKLDQNKGVLNVLSMVMKNSSIDVLPSISNIIDGVLMQHFDKQQKNNVTSHLRIFKIFLECLTRWLDIKPIISPIQSKKDKLKEMEEFTVGGINENSNFSDEIMGKTAEEMYEEDSKKSKTELEAEMYPQVEEYKKKEPPTHVQLTTLILQRSLNFLPSKDKSTKLLVLEILRTGLEIIREFEDDLLPIVHKIWSPLVGRFREYQEPLIICLSFQLLTHLARLSKDFIRSRTAKSIFPDFFKYFATLSKESYLKDTGSAYRHKQLYKLQECVLNNVGRLLVDLDTSEEDCKTIIKTIVPYLSNKQPKPLQKAAKASFGALAAYDKELVGAILKEVKPKTKTREFRANVEQVTSFIK